MANVTKQWLYSDVNLFSADKVATVADLDSINQSIYSILSTKPGERLFNPEFGSLLEELLFEPIDDRTAFMIWDYLVKALGTYEPRVRIHFGLTTVTPFPDDQKYEIVITYSSSTEGDLYFTYYGELFRRKIDEHYLM